MISCTLRVLKNGEAKATLLLFPTKCACFYLCLPPLFPPGFSSPSPGKNLLLPPDASALLDFKSKADLRNELGFSPKTGILFCKWEGVHCSNSRADKVIIENMNLGGVFAPNTLAQLRQLRVLSLQNNSLTGPIPDLSGLVNLKVLFLSRNYFSGSIPPSISTLHRLKTLDLSYNMLAGSIPPSLNGLDRLYYLRLDFNRFNGSVPPFNLSSLQIFNVSHNDLAGAVPVTPTLSRFNTTSFALNPGLCGQIIHKECHSTRPFFGQPSTTAAPPVSAALSQLQGGVALSSKSMMQKHKRAALVVGFTLGVSLFVISLLCFVFAARRCKKRSDKGEITKMGLDPSVTGNAEAVMRIEEENDELEEKVKRVQEGKQHQLQMVGKSGSLFFCAGEAQVYTLDQLMRASAELLGRGRLGPRSKSAKAKALHWTSCLKIAEDAAQGLCYIHQAWRLVHGNLKSSNVLLGSDFEACLTDYCLVALASPSSDEDANSIAYKAPETLKFNHREETTKSDVYSFGVLLLELLTGKHPSQHPNLKPDDMIGWMRSVRDEQSGENRLEMLLEVALACRVASPEQRPTMWQVLKMIQEIKEVVLMEDSEFDSNSGTS
ncbi:hypothetical protein DH2020_035377 [Rehmannia glutinosa]|uniref:Protein kinase domain-containing protein n=1 Tax=Rehmannia glutinosa TaxID=99300 RepID=A0ABR0V9V3_REHGL